MPNPSDTGFCPVCSRSDGTHASGCETQNGRQEEFSGSDGEDDGEEDQEEKILGLEKRLRALRGMLYERTYKLSTAESIRDSVVRKNGIIDSGRRQFRDEIDQMAREAGELEIKIGATTFFQSLFRGGELAKEKDRLSSLSREIAKKEKQYALGNESDLRRNQETAAAEEDVRMEKERHEKSAAERMAIEREMRQVEEELRKISDRP